MDVKETMQVGGFRFGTREDLELALQEEQKIDYFRSRTRNKSEKVLHALYDKLLDEKLFQTPVGMEYLRELQNELKSMGAQPDSIRPISLYNTYAHKTGEDLDREIIRQRIMTPKPKEKNLASFHISILLNVLLVILVIAMFVITLNSENANILNYRRAVLNEYSAWEQELTERESAVREKERAVMQAESEVNE